MRYTVCTDKSGNSAILFEGTDATAVAAIPELPDYFPGGYYVTLVHNHVSRWGSHSSTRHELKHTLVSRTISYSRPDEASADEEISWYFQGTMHTISLRKRFNNCLSMFKAVGCKMCPDLGATCLSEEIPGGPPELSRPGIGPDEIDKLFTAEKTLARHEYIHPSKTKREEFVMTIRNFREHCFSEVAANVENLSRRATKAASTRKFKKEQCSKCVISSSCVTAPWCKGAYPPEAEIVKDANNRLAEAIKNSDMPEWQIWELAKNVGLQAKHSRYQVVLTGVALNANKFSPTVYRAKESIDPYGKLGPYEDYVKVFGIADGPTEKNNPVTDPMLRATWWMALQSVRRHVGSGHGWGHSRQLIGTGISAGRVNLQWAKNHYLCWNQDIHTIADASKAITPNGLPDVDKIEVR